MRAVNVIVLQVGILLVSIAPVLIGSIELASVVRSMGHGINDVILLLVVTILVPKSHLANVAHGLDHIRTGGLSR